MPEYRTPGVYIEEKVRWSAASSAVVHYGHWVHCSTHSAPKLYRRNRTGFWDVLTRR